MFMTFMFTKSSFLSIFVSRESKCLDKASMTLNIESWLSVDNRDKKKELKWLITHVGDTKKNCEIQPSNLLEKALFTFIALFTFFSFFKDIKMSSWNKTHAYTRLNAYLAFLKQLSSEMRSWYGHLLNPVFFQYLRPVSQDVWAMFQKLCTLSPSFL